MRQIQRTFFLVTTLVLTMLGAATLLAGQEPAAPGAADAFSPIEIPAPAGAGSFGFAIDYDGATLVVGAPETAGGGVESRGKVFIYSVDPNAPGQWQFAQELTDPGGGEFDRFGDAVAVQGDIIVVGAPMKEVNGQAQLGEVFFFERTAANLAWQGTGSVSDMTAGSFANFGRDVDIDNGVVIVGAPGADAGGVSGKGKAYLYQRNNGQPGQWQGAGDFTDPAGQINDAFGSGVAISGDLVVVGAESADVTALFSNEGAAFVYAKNLVGNWTFQQQLNGGAAAKGSDLFGSAVDSDGEVIVVGAFAADRGSEFSHGAAFIFEPAAGGGWQLGKRLQADDSAEFDFLGLSVAVENGVVLAGAPDADAGLFEDTGAAYRFERPAGGAWAQVEKYTAASMADGIFLGAAVALHDGLPLAGAYGADGQAGAVYLFPEAEPGELRDIYLPVAVHAHTRPTGVLQNTGVVTETSGAVLGAVEGTLEEPVPVFLVATGAPATPLDPALTPVGHYYQIGAAAALSAPADKPFLVGLPVPDDADPAELAVALLVDTSNVHDYEDGEPYVWTLALGAYDPVTALFTTSAGQLLPAGTTFVIVAHPNHQQLPINPPPPGNDIFFRVVCGSYAASPSCTPDVLNAIALEARVHYDDFRALGFADPALNRHIPRFRPGLEPELIPYKEFYTIFVKPGNCSGAGEYRPDDKNLEVCVDPALGIKDEVKAAVRHELFHAVQFAYPGILADATKTPSNWVIEGTAAAAEESGLSMHRSPDYAIREIDRRLTFYQPQPDETAYRAQDFWVFIGQESNASLSYLELVFEQGTEEADVDVAFGGQLGDVYWRWVKNQAYERMITLDGALAPPCTLTGIPVMVSPPSPVLYQATDPPDMIVFDSALFKQKATVLTIVFGDDFPEVNVDVTHGGGDLRFKVYEQGEPGCDSVPDGARTLMDVKAGDQAYVVLANASYGSVSNFQVRLERPQ